MISSKQKRKIQGVLFYTLGVTFLGLIYALLEAGLLGDTNVYPSTQNPYSTKDSVIGILLGTSILGFFIGYLEMYLFDHLFIRANFGLKVLAKGLMYVLGTAVLLIILGWVVAVVKYQVPFYDPLALSNVAAFTYNFVFLTILIYASIGIILLIFIKAMSDSLGSGTLLNFVTGRYHQPQIEDRIFMFLDMYDSTPMAESIGHVRYFQLLNDCFSDITDAILDRGGEIYQYVGDEVVITWPIGIGLDRANYLKCFFEIKEVLISKSKYYEEFYGAIPAFKAGVHHGDVTAGELGVVKKQVMFSGDVLNTTARLRDLCKTHQTELIVSQGLIDMTPWKDEYDVALYGESELRGKTEEIGVVGVSPKGQKQDSP